MGTSPKQAQIDQLLREGIGAAKSGNKAVARDRLREVVALDDHNEKAWIWLASVVESDDERRVCLTNVLVINPQNDKAQKELNTIEQRAARAAAPPTGADEVAPGISRRTVGLLVVVGIAIVVLLGVLLSVLGRGGPPNEQPTQAAALPTANPVSTTTSVPTTVAGASTGASAAGASPGGPNDTPAPTVTQTAEGVFVAPNVRPTLPPTWTPEATATFLVAVTGTPLAAPPSSLPGRLVMISGPQITLEGFLPMYLLKPDGSDRHLVADDSTRGEYAILTPDGKLIYTYIASGTDSHLLRHMNPNGTQIRVLNDAWGGLPPLQDQRMPSISADGQHLAFAAQNVIGNEQFSAIYVVDLAYFLSKGQEPTATATATDAPAPTRAPPTPRPGSKITPPAVPTALPPTSAPEGTITSTPTVSEQYLARVTPKNIGENNWPAISPDGKTIVFATEGTAIGKDGTDLYTAPVKKDSKPTALTTDGSAFTEAAPDISPDGARIVFMAAPQGKPDKNDIIIIDSDGGNRETLVHVDGTNNIRPRWSPDGKFVAFSSDRSGKMQVYILELATKTLYQVTAGSESAILTDWGA